MPNIHSFINSLRRSQKIKVNSATSYDFSHFAKIKMIGNHDETPRYKQE